MKKFLALALALTMVISLAACGEKGEIKQKGEPGNQKHEKIDSVDDGGIKKSESNKSTDAVNSTSPYLDADVTMLNHEVTSVNHTRFKIPSDIIEGKRSLMEYFIAAFSYSLAQEGAELSEEEKAELRSMVNNGFIMDYNEMYMVVDASSSYVAVVSTYQNSENTKFEDITDIKSLVESVMQSNITDTEGSEGDTELVSSPDNFKVGELVAEDSTKKIYECTGINTGLTEEMNEVNVNMEGYLTVIIEDEYVSVAFVMYNSEEQPKDWALSFIKSIEIDPANPGTAESSAESLADMFGGIGDSEFGDIDVNEEGVVDWSFEDNTSTENGDTTTGDSELGEENWEFINPEDIPLENN